MSMRCCGKLLAHPSCVAGLPTHPEFGRATQYFDRWPSRANKIISAGSSCSRSARRTLTSDPTPIARLLFGNFPLLGCGSNCRQTGLPLGGALQDGVSARYFPLHPRTPSQLRPPPPPASGLLLLLLLLGHLPRLSPNPHPHPRSPQGSKSVLFHLPGGPGPSGLEVPSELGPSRSPHSACVTRNSKLAHHLIQSTQADKLIWGPG